MTTYELMCCYKSPNWYNYQNPLSPQYDYCHEKIEQNLPKTVVDSYLGRLVSLAKVVNNEVNKLTIDSFGEWLDVMPVFYNTGAFRGHLPRPQVRDQVKEYFELGFPADWIQALLQVFILELWTGSSLKTDLNDKKFLNAVKDLKRYPFKPVQNWFNEHPEATSETTTYIEEIKEETKEDDEECQELS